MQALPEFKRVVTGHNQHGLAIVASHGPTPTCSRCRRCRARCFMNCGTAAPPGCARQRQRPQQQTVQLSPAPLGSVIRVVDIPARQRAERSQR